MFCRGLGAMLIAHSILKRAELGYNKILRPGIKPCIAFITYSRCYFVGKRSLFSSVFLNVFFGIFGVYDDAIHINSISVHKQMNGCVLGAHIIHKEYNESSCTLKHRELS